MKKRFFVFLIATSCCIACAQKMYSWDAIPRHLPRYAPEMVLEGYAESKDKYESMDTMYFEWFHCTFSRFLLSKNEITNNQFCHFLNEDSIRINSELIKSSIDLTHPDNKIYAKDGKYYPVKGYPDYPVVLVSWWGAKEYCVWLTAYVNKKRTKSGSYGVPSYRLPTEFEWLVASSTNGVYHYSVEGICDTMPAYSDSVSACSRNIKLDTLNASGIAGMNGNVFEWMADDFYTVKETIVVYGYGHYYGDDGITSHALVRKHAFINGSTCGRLARLRTGFYSDTGFRIAQTYVTRSSDYDF